MYFLFEEKRIFRRKRTGMPAADHTRDSHSATKKERDVDTAKLKAGGALTGGRLPPSKGVRGQKPSAVPAGRKGGESYGFRARRGFRSGRRGRRRGTYQEAGSTTSARVRAIRAAHGPPEGSQWTAWRRPHTPTKAVAPTLTPLPTLQAAVKTDALYQRRLFEKRKAKPQSCRRAIRDHYGRSAERPPPASVARPGLSVIRRKCSTHFLLAVVRGRAAACTSTWVAISGILQRRRMRMVRLSSASSRRRSSQMPSHELLV